VGKGFWKGNNEVLEKPFAAEAFEEYLKDIATCLRESFAAETLEEPFTDEALEESFTDEALEESWECVQGYTEDVNEYA
jgi:hypothetical protein